MSLANDRNDFDKDDTVIATNGQSGPTRSRSRKKVQLRRKPKAKRSSSTEDAAKRGMHQRRNKRVNW